MKGDANRFRGCLLGLAVGDAVGTAVEFMSRGSFEPVTDMIGGGVLRLKAGQWTDDTSMALCLATSLTARKGFDPTDQMERYWEWFRHGYLSSTGECFDIGNTVRQALERFRHTGDPFSGSTDEYASGNGSLMRLAPVPMFYFPDVEKTLFFAKESSRTTHGSAECVEACQLLAEMILLALSGKEKNEILFQTTNPPMSPKITAIARGEYRSKSRKQIQGTGYVVSSLEAALWCFHTTASYEEAILEATNLGDDADTTAAICGQLAGTYYGESGIPVKWLDKLYMRNEIAKLADDLLLEGT